jgi:enterochelin esterase-like enzyme
VKWQSIFGTTALLVVALSSALAESPQGQVVDRQITSSNFSANKVGISPVRKMAIYLPPGYDASWRRYPVIYFLPNPFEENYRFDFDHRDARGLFDRAIAEGVIKDFILVAVDMNTPLGSSWYVNSPV